MRSDFIRHGRTNVCGHRILGLMEVNHVLDPGRDKHILLILNVLVLCELILLLFDNLLLA